MKKPKPLQQNHRVQIVAPSSHFKKSEYLAGVKVLEGLGLQCLARKDIFARELYFAGDDKRRATELSKALLDPKAQAVLFARGGYGAMRLLPHLQKMKTKPQPKIVAGFSDSTPVLNFVQQRWGWPVFYSPNVTSLAEESKTSLAMRSYVNTLFGKQTYPYAVKNLKVLKNGAAKARLVGGCLSLIAATLGTPFELKTDNCILFLEDVGEKPYAIDRMLTHLRLAGKFNKVKGVVWGSLSSVQSQKEYVAMLQNVFANDRFPVLFDFPAGHQKKRLTFPLGLPVEISSQKKTITFLESPWS